MNILISGGTGFIGKAVTAALEGEGHHVTHLTRHFAHDHQAKIEWTPSTGKINERSLLGFGAVIHLAGESISDGRWTPGKKNRIRESRIQGTQLLTKSLSAQSTPPKVFISGSAIGFYGDRGDETLTERSAGGSGFLATVCQEWEAAAKPAVDRGMRVVYLRSGIVLDQDGGALPKMIPPFRWGIGGKLGSGRQYMSWVSLDDEVGAILFALKNESLSGPINITAPEPVTNAAFTKALGNVLHRPALLPAPAVGLRLLLGEMADALLLSSARVVPEKLLQAGYQFRQSTLADALHAAFRT